MTREEAIDKWIAPAIKNTWNEKKCKEIMQALEQETCDTCEEYEKAVFEQINCWIGSGEYRYTNATDYLRKRVSEISSVQPKIGHWIPVSERLPNDEEYVLVCYLNGDIRTAYYYIDTSVYETEFEDCCETGWYNYNEDFMYDQDVIAWMSLPEPYKAESEN